MMCEPWVIHGRRDVPRRSDRWFHGTRELRGRLPGDPETDLDAAVAFHQERTVLNFATLRRLAPDIPWMPVLQGWEQASYRRCADWYEAIGVDLADQPIVGLGSVCRRQNTAEIGKIVGEFASRGWQLHGFGVKAEGLARYGHLLASADSMAWSTGARLGKRLAGCTHKAAKCQNCPRYALDWREKVVRSLAA